jgi:hypothetical protein
LDALFGLVRNVFGQWGIIQDQRDRAYGKAALPRYVAHGGEWAVVAIVQINSSGKHAPA